MTLRCVVSLAASTWKCPDVHVSDSTHFGKAATLRRRLAPIPHVTSSLASDELSAVQQSRACAKDRATTSTIDRRQ